MNGSQGQAPNFQASNMFDPSQLPPAPWPQPLSSTTNTPNGALNTTPANNNPPPVVPNVCHWQNCHQVFGTTPELLAHIAADHLNAPAVAAPPPANGPITDSNLINNMASILDTSNTPAQSFDLSSLQLNSSGVDPLMSCLWDDCFPSNPDLSTMNTFTSDASQVHVMGSTQSMPSSSQPSTAVNANGPMSHNVADHLQVHVPPHGHAQGQGHGHSHSHPTGEPFSPQTMLRHVLEEHLGLNSGDLSWNAPLLPPPVPASTPVLPSLSSAATTPVITPIHPVKPHHHHIPILPTPSPSTYTSSPPPRVKGLICLWPGCGSCSPFPDTASLMAHLSDEHIGKCKNTYTCLWDACGHAGGREFKSRQKVLRHLQSHIGHKPYVCDVCDQAFSEAAPLAAHKRRHAQESRSTLSLNFCSDSYSCRAVQVRASRMRQDICHFVFAHHPHGQSRSIASLPPFLSLMRHSALTMARNLSFARTATRVSSKPPT